VETEVRNVIIIGSGPAGLTAAVYNARANLKPLVIEGYGAGGQLMLTTEVENYPGFPEGVQGPEMMAKFREQAERFGAELLTRDVTQVDFSSHPFKVWVDDDLYLAKAIIISTGASAQWIGLPNERRLREIGGGVSSCAVCDGAFFKNQRAVVVGGGDTAMEDANYLTRHCAEVVVIHRRGELRASKIMAERAMRNPKIRFIWNSVVEDVLGSDRVTGLKLRNVLTGDVSEHPTDALFVAIGHKPNTELFEGKIALDDKGYIRLFENNETSVKGVFAAGDVHDTRYRQAITAAGSGCRAAIDAEHFLESLEDSHHA
jgi:thioredoxin reductase (NADPH)